MDAEAFLPRQGWRVKKPRHGREAQVEAEMRALLASRLREDGFSSYGGMLGAHFFGYFLQRLKKVTRAIARNG